MLSEQALDLAIIATPNQLHAEVAETCAAHGVHMLVEKPIADTLEAGARLVAAAEAAGVSVSVGHHRRFDPAVEMAYEIVSGGEIGRLVAVSAVWAARKPDDYYEEAAWRREPGGGPILINLIHDIDCLRHICGEIESVRAMTSSAAREFAVEDTAAILVAFESGALGTVTISDAAPSPWGWEAGSNDNPMIAASGENCYRFLGSKAAYDFPNPAIWRHIADGDGAGGGGETGDWRDEFARETRDLRPRQALADQLRHLCRVARGEDVPRVSGHEGLRTLAATLAVHEAARTGGTVRPADLLARASGG
ncbi:MAG: Gfo/Idh/MocA family oxidoreductase [Rhodospirillaceae bacterium]|nr:Gfo/Idh/MocA family oxidoreductase [Rhodospirillaceae bacterium]